MTSTISKITIKLILVGDTDVGKTTMASSYVNKTSGAECLSTIGIDYHTKKIKMPGYDVRLCIWDTAGQERFRSIVRTYYRGSHAVMVIFDLSNKETFDHAFEWIEQIKYTINIENYQILLVGNKADKFIEVEQNEINSLIDKYDGMKYIRTSIVKNKNIDAAFETLISDCVQNNIYQLDSNKHVPVIRTQELIMDPNTDSCCYIF